MSEKKYYCYCESNCRYETMTKEQILAAIAQAAAGGLVFDAEAAIVSKIKNMNTGGALTLWVGTQAQYNALTSVDPNCVYIKTDDAWQQNIETALRSHIENVGNAHGLTIEMIGAASAADLQKLSDNVASHQQNKENPHGVTIAQIGAAPAYSKGTTDLDAGASALAPNKLHFVYIKG